jgi:aminopeptidase YwaD
MIRELAGRISSCLSGEAAREQAAGQREIDRYFTFPNFEHSARRCERELMKAGLQDVTIEEFAADGETSWSGWRAMTAWDVERARVTMVSPFTETLADWQATPEALVMYSSPADFEGELVEWDGEGSVDLSGKVPLTGLRLLDVGARMEELDIPGVLSDFIGTLPGVRDRFDLPDSVRWENYAFKRSAGRRWGFMLTPRCGQMLRDLMRKGRVRVKIEIRSRTYKGIMPSVTGIIRGTDPGLGEVLLTSHLFEPGANDNGSGAGLALEIVRALNEAIGRGILGRPRRSIRVLFGWEGFGLMAWMHAHRREWPRILGGLNMDEVGVDQHKGSSVLHLFMPPLCNYSCTGLLAEHLCEELLTPALRWKAVSDRPEIINDAVTSDPTIDIALPTVIQYPSRFYHTSADTIETLSSEVLRLVGVFAATHLFFLADAGSRGAEYLSRLVAAGLSRKLLKIELALAEGAWRFPCERTVRLLSAQFRSALGSVGKFGLAADDLSALEGEIVGDIDRWSERWRKRFPAAEPRKASRADVERARGMILSRTGAGMTMPPEIVLPQGRSEEFFKVLYAHDLDLVFFRIVYWADGKRTLLEIAELLEMEIEEMKGEASIARTASGKLIEGTDGGEIDMRALLFIVEVLMDTGYLRAAGSGTPAAGSGGSSP